MSDTDAAALPPDLHHLPVIDLDVFRTLARVLGPERMAQMATTFFLDAERRLTLLERDNATPADLQDHAHALVSMAGHFGLQQLSTLCMGLQERARRNGGLDERPVLRRAVDDARAAVQTAITRGALIDGPEIDEVRAGPSSTKGWPAATSSARPADGAAAAVWSA